ncbi:hypothetical protein P5E67_05075 [Vibrio parahaemolyticus]|nr:hypothetical protein [Vibrio parahaemolyticus]
MQHTINKLAEILQRGGDSHVAGEMLAEAMAKDSMRYNEAHAVLHHMEEVAESAEKYLAKAAMKEMGDRAVDPSMFKAIY